MINSKLINKYYDKRAACQVLGTLMKEPYRLKSNENILLKNDFSSGMHEIIFICIYNLTYQDIKQINVSEIESCLATSSPVNYKKIFDDATNVEWLHKILQDANPLNYGYYYQKLKKMSLLRSYLNQGVIISDILDIDEIDPIIKQKQQENFDIMTIEDIIKICDQKIIMAKKDFIVKNNSEARKAGDEAEILYKKMKDSPSYGLGLESQYLNTVIRGMEKQKFMLETRDTGTGKSRVAIKRLLNITAPYLWSFDKQNFIKNPNGTDNSALYIGTEMDLYTEIEPMMWAFVSGVEENKIKDSNLTTDEDERIQRAIEILKDTKLFLENKPGFNVAYLWQIIEQYKKDHDIYGVALDYIELNNELISEFTNNTRGMGVREDQILLNLSENLKQIAEKINVFVNGFTQTTDEARRDGVRDQRAVKGARSIPNKADYGIVTFEPTKKEIEKLECIIQQKGLVKHKIPNVCYSFYKNRSGIQDHKDIKVWGYQNLGTMEHQDLFCTDKNYKLINVNPTKIEVVDDKISIM
ncbi:MAG: DnaB-like helicase C-terminal domain-containing protein [Bacilli bacterium]